MTMQNASLLFFCPLLICGMSYGGECVGKFLNPITDICWKCLFPIRIAGLAVVKSTMPDTKSPKQPVCVCKRPPANLPIPGIPIAFWEPVRLVEVTKTPFCLISLGGMSLGKLPAKGYTDDQQGDSFYHLHWTIYPVLYLLELLTDFICIEKKQYDLAYLTEFDPLWNDDSKSAILNPESLLFGNIVAQGACIADCMQASASLSNDALFWCCGCQGSLYPFTGSVGAQNGGVQGSLLLASRLMAKLHRQLLLYGHMGKKGLCGKYLMPVMHKSQYRLQMTYPIAEHKTCKRIGQTEVTWQAGKEYPVKGEDFAYLVWRKNDCCMTLY